MKTNPIGNLGRTWAEKIGIQLIDSKLKTGRKVLTKKGEKKEGGGGSQPTVAFFEQIQQ